MTNRSPTAALHTVHQSAAVRINGVPLTWAELTPALAEAAGGIVLEEAALDRMLRAELRRVGVALDTNAIAHERERLIESMRTQAHVASDDDTERLLQSMRTTRGLGPLRFDALLRRTAMLRALVQGSVAIDEHTIQTTYRILHGERLRVRILTTDTIAAAETALQRLHTGEPFGTVAAELSTDSSAQRGGALEPLSLADPSYPLALRETLRHCAAGSTTKPIAIDGGYAIAHVDSIRKADGIALESVRPAIERAARHTQERIAMGLLAQRLLRRAEVTPLDQSLYDAWHLHQGR